MFPQHCSLLPSSRAIRAAALVALAITGSLYLTNAASAVELVFDTAGYVNGKGALKKSASGNYQLRRGEGYRQIFSPIYGTGLSVVSSDLTFGGARNAKSIQFFTKATAQKDADGSAEMWTAPTANAGYQAIRVTVNPTSGEKKGTTVNINFVMTLRQSVGSRDGTTRNRAALVVNGGQRAEVTSYQTYNGQASFTIQAKIGGTFTVGMLGNSSARKGNSASQDWRIDMTGPVTAK